MGYRVFSYMNLQIFKLLADQLSSVAANTEDESDESDLVLDTRDSDGDLVLLVPP